MLERLRVHGALVVGVGMHVAIAAVSAAAQSTPPSDGAGLYEAACANCHGSGGNGPDPGAVAFQIPVPDFSDCSFASREPEADWVAVAHEGGPIRGFDPTMPAFGDALDANQLAAIIGYIRTFCRDARWPPGELNLPRALFTEKAYPEDEAVTTVAVDLDGTAVTNTVVYERRFGPVDQVEVVMPFGVRDPPGPGGAKLGIGDIELGWKRALFHDGDAGTIFSLGGEVALPTGSEENGFGSGTVRFEPFLAFGQILPGDAFFQAQAVVELSTDRGTREHEAAWRVVLGRSVEQTRFGRTWSPMLEVLGERAFTSGVDVQWDLVPQVQFTLNTRQHVMANVGLMVPVTDTGLRSTRLVIYILWDWFDGGFFDGW